MPKFQILFILLFFVVKAPSLTELRIPRCRESRSRFHALEEVPDAHGLPIFPSGQPRNLILPIRYVVLLTTRQDFDVTVIDEQHRVLNDCFYSTSFFFIKWEVLLVRDDNLANNCDVDQSQVFKTQTLQKYATFDANQELKVIPVFFCKLSYLGESTFPWQTIGSGGLPPYIQISASTLPGISKGMFYNEGKTLVHEMGHFLGLLHTFPLSASCTDPADMVDDTPAMSTPARGCPEGRDTCPAIPGQDPIHNYMGYTDDSCMYEFTPGQNERMQQIMLRYRPALVEQGLVIGNCTFGYCSCSQDTRKCTFKAGDGSLCGCATHGQCSFTGTCHCDVNYTGRHCEWCQPWTAGPNCTESVAEDAVAFFMAVLVPGDGTLAIPNVQLALVPYRSASSFGATTVRPDATQPGDGHWSGIAFAVQVTNASDGQLVNGTLGTRWPLQVTFHMRELWNLQKLVLLWWDGGRWLDPANTDHLPTPNISSVVSMDEDARTITFGLYHTGEFAIFESGGARLSASLWVVAAGLLLIHLHW
eukprot:GGOE01014877.1.p1 GENE.GGOE01014877.1~~GGOE01014877.1.p1  ORF type:complete len:531 (+),score=74.92 GGOE01014877.1:26-1618(+)